MMVSAHHRGFRVGNVDVTLILQKPKVRFRFITLKHNDRSCVGDG